MSQKAHKFACVILKYLAYDSHDNVISLVGKKFII